MGQDCTTPQGDVAYVYLCLLVMDIVDRCTAGPTSLVTPRTPSVITKGAAFDGYIYLLGIIGCFQNYAFITPFAYFGNVYL